MLYIIDNLKIIRTDALNQQEVLFSEDFNDISDYKALDFAATTIANLVTDNPFDPDDKVLKVANLEGAAATHLPILYNLILKKGETLTITCDVLAIADMTGIATNYSRIKAELYQYQAIDPNTPLILGHDRAAMEFSLLKMLEICQANDYALYIGELGSHYNTLDKDVNYEQWFSDISDIIGEHRLGFTWHSQVGGNYGLYTGRPLDVSTRHPEIYTMFQEYFMNITYSN